MNIIKKNVCIGAVMIVEMKSKGGRWPTAVVRQLAGDCSDASL